MSSRSHDETLRVGTPSGVGTDPGRVADAELKGPVGRYEILQRIGGGSMGTVFRALDPELDRHVALKAVQVDLWQPREQRRALREAQALAQLNHPNVVPVYDVGLHGGWVYIVMELIEGQSLARWRVAVEPPWRAIVRAFLDAGRGLAAAHAAGIVHRDVKPANLVVGEDGRVRVVDFGIARFDDPGDEKQPDLVSAGGWGALSETTAGMLLGTPRYMAPEQFRGRPATVLSDQYSFCVALYESLYQKPPYAPTELDALVQAKLDERILVPEVRRGIPAELEALLRRGMAADPGSRWPDLHVLLQRLTAALHPGHRRTAQVLAAGAAVGLAGLMAANGPGDCDDEARVIGEVWSPAVQQASATAFEAAGSTFGADTWQRTQKQLDARAQQWVDASRSTCLAAAAAGRLDPGVEQRRLCLDGELEHFRLLTQRLAEADLEAIRNAVEAAGAIRPQRCAASTFGPAVTQGAAGAEAQRTLAAIRSLQDTGRPAEAFEAAREAIAALDDVPPGPARSELLLEAATTAQDFGDLEAAAGWYELAYHQAQAEEIDTVAFEAAVDLVSLVGREGGDEQTGRKWARHAEALLDRLGRPPVLEAAYLGNLGLLETGAGKPQDAVPLLRRALALRLESLEPGDLRIAQSHNNLAIALEAEGSYDEAITEHRRALEIRVDALGPDHPVVAASHNNLGVVYLSQDRGELARAELQQALDSWERAVGPDHPDVALALNNLGREALQDGRVADAVRLYERALALLERARGPEHPDVAMTSNNLGAAYAAMGDNEKALAMGERSLAIYRAVHGERHPHVAIAMSGVAATLEHMGRYDEARSLRERALEIQREVAGPEHPDTAIAMVDLAANLRKAGELDRAIDMFGQGVAIMESALGEDHVELARFLTNLGEALAAAGRTDEAVGALQRALSIIERTHGPDHAFVAYPLHRLAHVHLDRRKHELARAELERAVRAAEAVPVPPTGLHEMQFELAQLRWSAGARAEARALAGKARQGFADAGEPEHAAEVTRWLRRRS